MLAEAVPLPAFTRNINGAEHQVWSVQKKHVFNEIFSEPEL